MQNRTKDEEKVFDIYKKVAHFFNGRPINICVGVIYCMLINLIRASHNNINDQFAMLTNFNEDCKKELINLSMANNNRDDTFTIQ